MDAEQWKRIKNIYQTVEELEPEERSVYLDESCKDDADLRLEVEAMLSAGTDTGVILTPPSNAEGTSIQIGEKRIGTLIGRYHLTRIISSGGMGTVYEAIQEHPKRTVAVKVMKAGIASQSALRRFEYEAQILAKLRHPHIAQVIEAGTHVEGEEGAEGVPYFVMEYIPEARPITEYAQSKALLTSERLRLFMQVSDAVHHGHQKGIIHRDLKPANLLVDASGQVKIIDFGIAKATDADLALTTVHTDVGQLLGTVQYMSPEQCVGDTHDLDLRSDVYSLGVVLYELLCGKLPYEARRIPIYEATRRIREWPPERPSTVDRALRGDLETIVLKALEKDRDRRYPSADEFRRDLDRYLKGEPILARPPTTVYLLRAFTRRHKALVFGTAAVFIVLVAGIITTTMNSIRADREAQVAKDINQFFNRMLATADPFQIDRLSDPGSEEWVSPLRLDQFGRDISVAEMMELAESKIEGTFVDRPDHRALIHETFGNTFHSLGTLDKAEIHLRKAFVIRREQWGADHIDTLRLQVKLADLLARFNKADEAVHLARTALEKIVPILGEEDRNTLQCKFVLAYSLYSQKKFVESNTLFRETLKAQRRTLGNKDRHTLRTMLDWAFVLEHQAMMDEAYSVIQVLHDATRGLSRNDVLRILSDNMRGSIFYFQGEGSEAEKIYREVLENYKDILGEGHPTTSLTKMVLALLINDTEKVNERDRLHEETIQYSRDKLGEENLLTDTAIWNYLNFLREQQQFDKIEALSRDILERRRRALGEGHPLTLMMMKELAAFLLERGRKEESLSLYRQWIDLTVHTHGSGHFESLNALMTAAEAFQEAGEGEEAVDHVERALREGKQRIEGPDATPMDMEAYARLLLTCEPEDLRRPFEALELVEIAAELNHDEDYEILSILALAYHRIGDDEKAVQIQRKAIDVFPLKAIHNSPEGRIKNLSKLEIELARYLYHRGDEQEALEYLRARRTKIRDSFKSMLCQVQFDDAKLFIELDRFALAEPLLKAAYDQVKQHVFRRSFNSEILTTLIGLYESWGKPGEAAKWGEKLQAME